MLRRLGVAVQDYRLVAVHDVNLQIAPGEMLGLVGESGCGKSTLGRIVSGLRAPSSGAVRYNGVRVDAAGTRLPARERLKIQMVFQDPMASLNPRRRVGELIAEGAVYHGLWTRSEAAQRVADLLVEVGLDPSHARRYPHQFSGGQRQRIAIAQALSVNPDVLVCDEPVAALDVSIQAQVLNLLMELRRRRNLTCLFISHDLAVIRHLCDRVAVMYLGRIVELAPARSIFDDARHPYTRALLGEILRIDGGRRQFTPIQGELPSPLHPPAGCAFHPRCAKASAVCRVEAPPLQAQDGARAVACHHPG
ncbi:MAG: ATP-binding cassette domain-containing protein [Rhodoferax sp.]|nr:ATP-binding cassette domain-containing protein [Rhodoferax sp.]